MPFSISIQGNPTSVAIGQAITILWDTEDAFEASSIIFWGPPGVIAIIRDLDVLGGESGSFQYMIPADGVNGLVEPAAGYYIMLEESGGAHTSDTGMFEITEAASAALSRGVRRFHGVTPAHIGHLRQLVASLFGGSYLAE